jgi:hypothetical protein
MKLAVSRTLKTLDQPTKELMRSIVHLQTMASEIASTPA